MSKTQNIYSKMNETVYFSIPKDIHFGYDNYFMIHLLDSLRKTSKKYNYPDLSKTKVVVLN